MMRYERIGLADVVAWVGMAVLIGAIAAELLRRAGWL